MSDNLAPAPSGSATQDALPELGVGGSGSAVANINPQPTPPESIQGHISPPGGSTPGTKRLGLARPERYFPYSAPATPKEAAGEVAVSPQHRLQARYRTRRRGGYCAATSQEQEEEAEMKEVEDMIVVVQGNEGYSPRHLGPLNKIRSSWSRRVSEPLASVSRY